MSSLLPSLMSNGKSAKPKESSCNTNQYRNSKAEAVFEPILNATLKDSKTGLFLQNLDEAYLIQ